MPELIAASATLLAAMLAYAGVLVQKRVEASQARRRQLLDLYAEAMREFMRGEKMASLTATRVIFAQVGDRDMFRKSVTAEDPLAGIEADHKMLLKVINQERKAHRQEPLDLADIHHMMFDHDSAARQIAFEQGESVTLPEQQEQLRQRLTRPPQRP